MTKRIYSVAEKILRSDTSDLKKLAKIAGISPQEMYAGADLTDADLRDQDISFLHELQTRFEKAILTHEQRAMLTAIRRLP